MMWEQIRANRRKSAILVLMLFLLLLGLGIAIAEAYAPGSGMVGGGIAFIVWLVMSLVAYYQGDNILLSVSGATEIEKSDYPQLFNIVEEMQIASGSTKMPRVFLIDDMALNAFATGRDPDNAAVAVTAGLLGRLNRDELQGVIAHEMSHVVNRDVLLMTMVGVLLGAIVMLSDLFLRSMRFGGRSRRYGSSRGAGQAQAIMFVVALLLAILAPFIAQLIYFAVSRRREYLADAGAAVLTRYPEGLASALETISTDANVLASANKATAPMYIANPFHSTGLFGTSLSSTHPPIEERIKVLRTMAGGASFLNYDEAWRQVRGKHRSVLPSSALAQSGAVPIRAASADSASQDPRARMRQAGDLLRKVNQYLFMACACGLRIKLPPTFQHGSVKCPRCGRENEVPAAQVAAIAQAGALLSEPAPPAFPGDPSPMTAAPMRVATPKGGTPPPAEPPLSAQRVAGQWTSFRCACGSTVTLSPAIATSHVRCNSCGRTIQLSDRQ